MQTSSISSVRHRSHPTKIAAFLCAWSVVSLLYQSGLPTTALAVQSVPQTPAEAVKEQVSEADKRRIESWIEQLGDASYIKRQMAREALERTGLPAFESLRAAENHSNLEIAHTAAFLLQSMNVDWTSATDSFDVHQLLKDYNDRNQSSKLLCVQRLAFLKRADGYIALMRLLRYDNDEILSKTAALHLFEAAVDPDEAVSIKYKISDWPFLLRNGLGDTNRVGASWLLALATALEKPEDTTENWRSLVLAERKLLESNARSANREFKTNDEVVKLLYRNIAKLLIKQDRRAAAVAFFEPCLELVGTSATGVDGDIQWMLEAGLPESVIALSDQYPDLFVAKPKFRYWLAESYLRTGQSTRAEEIAADARQMLHIKRDSNYKATAGRYDNECVQRMSMAETLNQRGMYAWSEAEMLVIRQLQSQAGLMPIEQQLQFCDQFALFYDQGDQPAKAAAVWQPLLKRAGLIDKPDSPDQGAQGSTEKDPVEKEATPKEPIEKEPIEKEPIDKELLTYLEEMRTLDLKRYSVYVVGRYYYFLGLAATKEGNLAEARQHLLKAIATDDDDPDFLIALYRVVNDDRQAEAKLTGAIAKLEAQYRNEIIRSEGELAAATSRSDRAASAENIALACNQLAWLMAGTRRQSIEAIALSERSLMLKDNDPVYLDTLARCYFSAGNIEKAIHIQSRAVSMRPNERSMKRQLNEFMAAKLAKP